VREKEKCQAEVLEKPLDFIVAEKQLANMHLNCLFRFALFWSA